MGNQPKRKPIRIKQYDYSTAGAYFITVCVKNRRRILCDIVGDDAHIVPKPCGKIVEKYIGNVPEIEKYCMMPDHIHMLIRLENGSMWASTPTKRIENIVRSLKTLTTKETVGADAHIRPHSHNPHRRGGCPHPPA